MSTPRVPHVPPAREDADKTNKKGQPLVTYSLQARAQGRPQCAAQTLAGSLLLLLALPAPPSVLLHRARLATLLLFCAAQLHAAFHPSHVTHPLLASRPAVPHPSPHPPHPSPPHPPRPSPPAPVAGRQGSGHPPGQELGAHPGGEAAQQGQLGGNQAGAPARLARPARAVLCCAVPCQRGPTTGDGGRAAQLQQQRLAHQLPHCCVSFPTFLPHPACLARLPQDMVREREERLAALRAELTARGRSAEHIGEMLGISPINAVLWWGPAASACGLTS